MPDLIDIINTEENSPILKTIGVLDTNMLIALHSLSSIASSKVQDDGAHRILAYQSALRDFREGIDSVFKGDYDERRRNRAYDFGHEVATNLALGIEDSEINDGETAGINETKLDTYGRFGAQLFNVLNYLESEISRLVQVKTWPFDFLLARLSQSHPEYKIHADNLRKVLYIDGRLTARILENPFSQDEIAGFEREPKFGDNLALGINYLLRGNLSGAQDRLTRASAQTGDDDQLAQLIGSVSSNAGVAYRLLETPYKKIRLAQQFETPHVNAA